MHLPFCSNTAPGPNTAESQKPCIYHRFSLLLTTYRYGIGVPATAMLGGGVHLIDEDLDAHIHESGFGFKQVKLHPPNALF